MLTFSFSYFSRIIGVLSAPGGFLQYSGFAPRIDGNIHPRRTTHPPDIDIGYLRHVAP
jgi:hypothetical protein